MLIQQGLTTVGLLVLIGAISYASYDLIYRKDLTNSTAEQQARERKRHKKRRMIQDALNTLGYFTLNIANQFSPHGSPYGALNVAIPKAK